MEQLDATSVEPAASTVESAAKEAAIETQQERTELDETAQDDILSGPYRFLVSIHHPAQVHFYRYIIETLRAEGHSVKICVRDKEMTSELLSAFGIEHSVLANSHDSRLGTAMTQLAYESRLLRKALRFEPDVLTSIGGIEISHIAPFVGAKTLAFMDTPSRMARLLTAPWLDATCTPARFAGNVRGEQKRYDGYQELAYLHPNRFEPRPDRLRPYGIDPDNRIFLLRFVSWNAYHDVGEHGFSMQDKRDLISVLSHHGTVYITSEEPLPAPFKAYELPIPPHLIHDLLSVADLFVGDSGTMATEAAVLGTPAIRVSSVVANGDMANFVELEESFDLLYTFAEGERAVDHIEELVKDSTLKSRWQHRRKRLLDEKIDVTAYAVEQLTQLGKESQDT